LVSRLGRLILQKQIYVRQYVYMFYYIYIIRIFLRFKIKFSEVSINIYVRIKVRTFGEYIYVIKWTFTSLNFDLYTVISTVFLDLFFSFFVDKVTVSAFTTYCTTIKENLPDRYFKRRIVVYILRPFYAITPIPRSV